MSQGDAALAKVPSDVRRGPRVAPIFGHMRRGKILKWVRRFHMYMGLLLTPWVLFYGVSGVLFNHPQLGRAIESHAIDAKSAAATTGFGGFAAPSIADEVLTALARDHGHALTLDASRAPELWGWPLFATKPTPQGRHVVVADLRTGAVTVSRHEAPAREESAPFADEVIALPQYQMSALAPRLQKLLPAPASGEPAQLRPHPQVAPELRFAASDARGTRWNLSWNMGTGKLAARAAEAETPEPFVELLGALHTSHHYPVHGGIGALWALMADLAGVALVLWALTGLVMWWQMRPSRVLGTLAISVALAAAALVMTTMARDLEHVPPAKAAGP